MDVESHPHSNQIPVTLTVNGESYAIICLLGHGKGGYSYLAEGNGDRMVVKQIHHEPCDYYTFGNKIEAERYDYQRIAAAGIRMPRMLDLDEATERIVKEYVDGPTIAELVERGISVEPYLPQVQEMSRRGRAAGLNIDWYPTNFVVDAAGLLFYVDYECNGFMEEWSLETWGMRYWVV